MTYMSCEAVTAGLVLTGLVHADPHEGNLMLADDGRLVFLDFGLMSSVDESVMEAFASGIQCVLSKDYLGLVQAFIGTGFVGSPIEWRPRDGAPWQRTHPDGDTSQVMAKELRERMEACPGGGSRFGALSIVLGDMGIFWQMYTPPYVILLIRTFLTLEGIASQVDPSFNIYEVALPWAVQRALSPATPSGVQALRNSLLTADNKFQWQRVDTLIEQQQAQQREERESRERAAQQAAAETADRESLPAAGSARARLLAAEAAQADVDLARRSADADAQSQQASTPLDSLTTVLGSASGVTLRRIARDIDSTELLLRLASPSARPARRLAVQKLASAVQQSVGRRVGEVAPAARARAEGATQPWPRSEHASLREKRHSTRARAVTVALLRSHLRRLACSGWRGAAAVCALSFVVMRVGLAALMRAAARSSAAALGKALPTPIVAAAAAAAASLATVIGRELTALGASISAVGDELSDASGKENSDGAASTAAFT